MGGSYSVPEKDIEAIDGLMADIQVTAESLTRRYKNSFSDPEYCREMAMLYASELEDVDQFRIDGIAYRLGMSVQGREKEKVCKKIAQNYVARLHLISAIENTLPDCYRRLNALSRGPICKSDPEVFNRDKCRDWNFNVSPPPNIPENSKWYEMVTKAFTTFNNHLYKMKSILEELKAYETGITDQRLGEMGEQVQQSIEILYEGCVSNYRKAVKLDTLTRKEAKEKREETPENLEKHLHRAYGVE